MKLTRVVKVECDYEILDNLTKITRISEKDISKTCTLCRQETNGRTRRGLYRCKLYRKQFNADANGALNIIKSIKSRCSI